MSIDDRPSVVEDKNRIGDWEIDLVIGKDHSDALVTIVERKTSFTASLWVDDKSATIALLQPFKGVVFTIVADNSKEFSYHEVITEYLKCSVYFADLYCSWQRGLHENTNGLLRQ